MVNNTRWESFGQDYMRFGKKVYLMGIGCADILDPDKHPKVAIIGSRTGTNYGRRICREWGQVFVKAGLGLVTGAATGIDLAASKAFQEFGGTVVEVLASSIDNMPTLSTYKYLRDLLSDEKVLSAVVSQYPRGQTTERWMFAKRNETIALLADAVLVVEAAGASGSFHTVAAAKALGLPVFAVPGQVEDALSVGTNILIRSGDAKMALCPGDIVEAIREWRC